MIIFKEEDNNDNQTEVNPLESIDTSNPPTHETNELDVELEKR